VSNRIGIAEGEDPVKVEQQLCAALPTSKWTLASDVQILHGRRVCRPKPLCDQCSVREDCDYFNRVISQDRGPIQSGQANRKPPAAKRQSSAPRRAPRKTSTAPTGRVPPKPRRREPAPPKPRRGEGE